MRSTCRSHAGCVVKVGGWLPALCSHHGRHPPCAVHRFSPVLQAVAKSTPTLQRRCRRQTACSAAPAAPAAQSGPQPAEDVPAAPAQAEGPGSRGGPDSADAVTVSEEKLPQSHVRLTVHRAARLRAQVLRQGRQAAARQDARPRLSPRQEGARRADPPRHPSPACVLCWHRSAMAQPSARSQHLHFLHAPSSLRLLPRHVAHGMSQHVACPPAGAAAYPDRCARRRGGGQRHLRGARAEGRPAGGVYCTANNQVAGLYCIICVYHDMLPPVQTPV